MAIHQLCCFSDAAYETESRKLPSANNTSQGLKQSLVKIKMGTDTTEAFVKASCGRVRVDGRNSSSCG